MADWLPELTDDDLATLQEALEAWESKDAAGEMFGDVIEALLTDRMPERQAQGVAATRAAQKLKAQRAQAVRKERSVILRAKLLTLRDRRRVESAAAAAIAPIDPCD
jgi:hypothetical protein